MQLPKISILITLMICLFGVNPAMAEPGDHPTPTTRILAIGTVNPGVDISKVQTILPEEMRETAKLYLDGKIDLWFSLENRPGVVFILNVTDTDAAAAMLEKLPLGQAHFMHFELMPLGPLMPLRKLLGPPAAPH
ncbi:MAG: hypothetical protein WBX25_01750 [Rhodomicrobium sp.]